MCDHTQGERSSGIVRLPGLPPLTGGGQLQGVSCSVTVHVKLGPRGARVGHLQQRDDKPLSPTSTAPWCRKSPPAPEQVTPRSWSQEVQCPLAWSGGRGGGGGDHLGSLAGPGGGGPHVTEWLH